jgi:hypothetical protein
MSRLSEALHRTSSRSRSLSPLLDRDRRRARVPSFDSPPRVGLRRYRRSRDEDEEEEAEEDGNDGEHEGREAQEDEGGEDHLHDQHQEEHKVDYDGRVRQPGVDFHLPVQDMWAHREANEDDDDPGLAQNIPVWRYAPVVEVDFSHIIEEVTAYPDWCFLCSHGQSMTEAEKNKRFLGLLTFMNESYHKMTPVTFCQAVQRIYKTKLRPHLQRRALHTRPWLCKTIWAHVQTHAPSMQIYLERVVRTINSVMTVLEEEGIIEENVSGGGVAARGRKHPRAVNEKAFRLYLLCVEKRKPILTALSALRPATTL